MKKRKWRIVGPWLLAFVILAVLPGRPAAANGLQAEKEAVVTPLPAPELAAPEQVDLTRDLGRSGLRLTQRILGGPEFSIAAQASGSTTATATPVCLPDVAEPNDNPATARTMPAQGLIRDLTLCPAGDVDYFALQALSGQRYAVETVVEPGLDTLLAVSQNGQTNGQNNDKSSGDHGSRVEFDSPYGGEFTLVVSDVSASGAAGLHYTLLVTANPLPTGTPWPTSTSTQTGTPTLTPTLTPIPSPSPTPVPCLDAYEDDGVAATAKAILPGETQAHLFCPAGDADWLTFFANSGKGYRIETVALGSGADTYLYLFAPDGATVLASNDDAPGQHGPSRLVFYPPADGWYFVQVKNQGDIGFPGLGYKVSLSIVDAPSSTPDPTSTAPATATTAPSNTPTTTASATPTNTPTSSSVPPTSTTAPASESQMDSVPAENTAAVVVVTATPVAPAADDLLRPRGGGSASGGVPVFDAGPTDAMQPDKLEPDDTFSNAVAINVGAVYQHLNFVPAADGTADGDFYSFRAKPGLCYAVQTGDLSAGLDTTILLWQAGITREARQLVAQNDDAQPKTADLSSSVRWCSPADSFMVIELHNYGWAPQTDPRGKSYSLAVLIDPPTPTPTRTARPADTGAATTSGSVAGRASGGSSAQGAAGSSAAGASVAVPATPTWTPTATGTATATPSTTAAPATVTADLAGGISSTSTPGGPTQTSTFTATATATATVTAIPTAVADLTCYLDLNQNEAPDPGEGIAGLRGVVIDTTSNAIIVEARSDANGHIQLQWPGRASVRIALPDLGWNQEVLATQLQRAKDEPAGGGHWSAEVRVKAPALPGILP